jgi:CubicO group peptidase (beta-lactamase class C family)
MKQLLFILLSFNGIVQAQQSYDPVIENSLIPSIILEKDSGKAYSIAERMTFYHVQGLSIVAFEKNKITWQKVFGLAKVNKNEKVTHKTRFQVASISKTVTALGVLKLADRYHLDIDTDVNQYLKTWRVPENQYTIENKVTIRGLLNHTAGINIEGFLGYAPAQKIPTIQDILEGKGATPKIEVVVKPNTTFSYSGGGYLILVKLIEDISGMSFENFIHQNVFVPLKMRNSSFYQYSQQNQSYGYDQDGLMAEYGWRNMPELAPNGLWTTAEDLALFCMGIQAGFEGKKNAILSQKWIKQMLEKSAFMDYGLGLGVKMDDTNHYFFHAGQNPGGYCGIVIGDLKKRKGLVVLTNSEDNHLLREIINGYAKSNGMGFAKGFAGPQEIIKTITLSEKEWSEFEGKYQNDIQKELEVNINKSKDNSLIMNYLHNGYNAFLHPISKDTFYEIFTGLEINFFRNSSTNQIEGVERRGRKFIRK